MFVEDFLAELVAMLEELELEGVDELSEELDGAPELDELCRNLWLLELIVAVCKQRRGS